MRVERLPARPRLRARGATTDPLREALLDLSHGRARIVAHSERSWASVTFAGTRHRLVLAFEGAAAIDAGERLIALLPEHEFDLPGQLVADANVVEVDHRMQPQRMQVTCELLLLDEG